MGHQEMNCPVTCYAVGLHDRCRSLPAELFYSNIPPDTPSQPAHHSPPHHWLLHIYVSGCIQTARVAVSALVLVDNSWGVCPPIHSSYATCLQHPQKCITVQPPQQNLMSRNISGGTELTHRPHVTPFSPRPSAKPQVHQSW